MSQRITDQKDIDAITQQIRRMTKMDGWFSFDGDASVQAAFVLPSGNLFRVGITDGDVAMAFYEERIDELLSNSGVVWIDAQYRELATQ